MPPAKKKKKKTIRNSKLIKLQGTKFICKIF